MHTLEEVFLSDFPEIGWHGELQQFRLVFHKGKSDEARMQPIGKKN